MTATMPEYGKSADGLTAARVGDLAYIAVPVGALTATPKAAQAMAALVLGLALDASAYRHTLNDPFSLPSLTMAGGLIVLALACAAMALIQPGRSSYE